MSTVAGFKAFVVAHETGPLQELVHYLSSLKISLSLSLSLDTVAVKGSRLSVRELRSLCVQSFLPVVF